MIPLKIENKHLVQIFEPTWSITGKTEAEINAYSVDKQMFPTSVNLTSESYSRDAERTANYELETLQLVNAKAKPEFTWDLIKVDYVQKLLTFLKFHYNFEVNGEIVPEDAPTLNITYLDFTGMRTIKTYLGQTIQGELVEYDGVQYWKDFRIAFPER
jgi:hypothetical protein